jgi:hypothetical protein
MIALILGFGSAALFLGLSMVVYGVDALAQSAWVALVFSGLIGSGLAVYAISRPMPAWLCHLVERIKHTDVPWHVGDPCHC